MPRCLVELTIIEFNDGSYELVGIEFIKTINIKQFTFSDEFEEYETTKNLLKAENAIIKYNSLREQLPTPKNLLEIKFN